MVQKLDESLYGILKNPFCNFTDLTPAEGSIIQHSPISQIYENVERSCGVRWNSKLQCDTASRVPPSGDQDR
jgi:hypothetical protein